MSFYNTGSSFSLNIGKQYHIYKLICNANSRTDGIVLPNLPSNSITSVYINTPKNIEDNSDNHLAQHTLLNSLNTFNFLEISSGANLNYIRICAYNGGTFESTGNKLYQNGILLNDIGNVGVINSVVCSVDGTNYVCIENTGSNVLVNNNKFTIGTSLIETRMTVDGTTFSVLDYTGKLYIYNTNRLTHQTYSENLSMRTTCIFDTGSYLFYENGKIVGITHGTTLVSAELFPTNMPRNILWDSSCCSKDGRFSSTVGFTQSGSLYNATIYSTTDGWNTYTQSNSISSLNGSGTSIFMSNDGGKQWANVNFNLYYYDNSSWNMLTPTLSTNKSINVLFGTCSPSGNIVYIINNEGTNSNPIYTTYISTDGGNNFTTLF